MDTGGLKERRTGGQEDWGRGGPVEDWRLLIGLEEDWEARATGGGAGVAGGNRDHYKQCG